MSATETHVTPLQALSRVNEANHMRDEALVRAQKIREDADNERVVARQRAEGIHRDANRALVDAIRDGQRAGLQIQDMLKAIGKSRVWLSRAEAVIEGWDEEERTRRFEP